MIWDLTKEPKASERCGCSQAPMGGGEANRGNIVGRGP